LPVIQTYTVNSGGDGYLIDSNTGITATSTDTLTNKTLTAATINALALNGALTGDAMSTDLSSSAAGDEGAFADAIKTYVDVTAASAGLLNSATSAQAGHLEFQVSVGVGIMVAWGIDTASSGGSATFEKAFSAAPWVVVVGADDSAGGGSSATASLDTASSSGFSYGSSGATDRINYVAIGPTTI
jgi:hypothetical protein